MADLRLENAHLSASVAASLGRCVRHQEIVDKKAEWDWVQKAGLSTRNGEGDRAEGDTCKENTEGQTGTEVV